MNPTTNPFFIRSKRILFRPLAEADYTEEYLGWLNDPEVNRFSQRRPFPGAPETMRAYNDFYVKNPSQGFVLAMIDEGDGTHIGNISMVNIQPVHRCGEIAILIGNKNYWNRGYARESIYRLTRHGFEELNLHRIFAGSFNPAFVKAVEKNGWTKEGVFRERIWSAGRYHDQVWLSILRREFKPIPDFERNGI